MNTVTTPNPIPLQRRRRSSPTINVDVDVSLDEFDTDVIRQYLRDQDGEEVESAETDGCYIDVATCNQISTLALCGQKEEAVKLTMQIVSRAIGREIKP